MTQISRRGFLAGLFGTAVIAVVPKTALLEVAAPTPIEPIDPWSIKARDSITHQWVRTALLGVPDPENVQNRIDNGWTFVVPDMHPGAPVSTVQSAIETCELILMQKPTQAVQQTLAAEREAAYQKFPFVVQK